MFYKTVSPLYGHIRTSNVGGVLNLLPVHTLVTSNDGTRQQFSFAIINLHRIYDKNQGIMQSYYVMQYVCRNRNFHAM